MLDVAGGNTGGATVVAGASVVVLGADDVLLVGLRVVVGSVVTGGRVVGLGDSEDSCPGWKQPNNHEIKKKKKKLVLPAYHSYSNKCKLQASSFF